MGATVTITDSTFDAEVLKSDKPVVVHEHLPNGEALGSDWCACV